MERYSLEDHEVYRKEQDEKAARKTEGRSERMEKESARRAWIADGGAGRTFRARVAEAPRGGAAPACCGRRP